MFFGSKRVDMVFLHEKGLRQIGAGLGTPVKEQQENRDWVSSYSV